MRKRRIELGDIVRHRRSGFQGVADVKLTYYGLCSIEWRVSPKQPRKGRHAKPRIFAQSELKVVRRARSGRAQRTSA